MLSLERLLVGGQRRRNDESKAVLEAMGDPDRLRQVWRGADDPDILFVPLHSREDLLTRSRVDAVSDLGTKAEICMKEPRQIRKTDRLGYAHTDHLFGASELL